MPISMQSLAEAASGVGAAVGLSDGRVFDARLERRDPRRDLVALRIDAESLPAARLGDSRRVRAGDVAVACGHPFRMTNVITTGIVHAVLAHPGANGDRWIRADVAPARAARCAR